MTADRIWIIQMIKLTSQEENTEDNTPIIKAGPALLQKQHILDAVALSIWPLR